LDHGLLLATASGRMDCGSSMTIFGTLISIKWVRPE
jgi:hypothetical protein